jgi:mono/diheme cytochrome c family protein
MAMPTALLGTTFAIVGLAAMFLMYHLWGYPYDKATRTSAAPRWAMLLHRALGYAFAGIYVVLMWKMLPRLWEYQVEFPARTVVHIVLGFTIGFLLLIKIAILRFFRHFEEWMPVLGTAIVLGTIVLLGLSLPYVFQERQLSETAFTEQNRIRVAQLLPSANLPTTAPSASELSTLAALENGRDVLLGDCVKCHDLKTILAKPRSPSGWWSTVERMSEKPALFDPISERDMFDVTAYLIAITPDLQRSTKQKYRQQIAREQAITESGVMTSKPKAAVNDPVPATPTPRIDLTLAKQTYEEVCSQCHELDEITKAPPRTAADSHEMIERMIRDNEAEISAPQIELIAAWLDAEYVGNPR